MNGPALKPKFFGRYHPYFLYGVILLILLKMSWMRWGDLIIDSGYEWSVPSQILSGKLLYRDLAWYFGPLIPYWNALFLWIAGGHLGGLVASGILSLLLTTVALHLLARAVLGEWLAGVTVATFLCVMAFGFYVSPHNYNYILPYTYSATYGMAFALWTFHSFGGILKGQGTGLPMTLFLGLTLLTRFEMGVAVSVAALLSAGWWVQGGGDRARAAFRATLGSILVAGAGAVLVYTLFSILTGSGEVWSALVTRLPFNSFFALGLSGFDLAGQNLLGMAVTVGLYLAFTLLFVAAGQGAQGAAGTQAGPKTWIVTGLPFLFALAMVLYLARNLFGAPAQFRCLPLICLYLAWTLLRKPAAEVSPRDILYLALCLFSFGVLLRILLKVWVGQYGFTLLVPGLIVYHGFFLEHLPQRFPEGRARSFVRGGFLCLCLFFLVTNLTVQAGFNEKSTYAVGTSRGTLSFFPTEPALSLKGLLDYLGHNSDVGDTMTVFPEGSALNFLSGLPNPVAFQFTNPLDLSRPGAQRRVIEGLEGNKVTFVVLLQRDTSEYGRSSFGVDYGKDIMGYVFAHYSAVQQFGPFPYTTPYFGITVLKRHSDVVIER